MLVEEINEKTGYDLLLQPWQQHGNSETRIRVKHKPSEMDNLVRAIQLFGLSRNKALDADRIKAAVDALISNVEQPSEQSAQKRVRAGQLSDPLPQEGD